jgi:hypothetical protein
LGSVFIFLSFIGSSLVSSSPSEVWQFKFVCCPQVLEISSVAQQLSCLGVRFLLCWFTGGLFFCFTPFLWVKVSDLPSAISVLWWFAVCFSILQCHLTLDVAHWLKI